MKKYTMFAYRSRITRAWISYVFGTSTALAAVLGIVSMTLLGCAPSNDAIRAQNRENLLKLSMGMSKAEVLQIMGTKTIKSDGDWTINNPYKSEMLKGKDGIVYELLFYYTDMKAADNAITDDELTPLVFKDKELLGWGWSFVNDNVEKREVRVR